MNLQDKKQIFLEAVRSSVDLSSNIKKQFEEQVLKMNEDEFDIFLNSLKEAQNGSDIDKKISQMKAKEKESHEDFLKTGSDFLKNDTQQRLKKQEEVDRSKAETLLNKIKNS